MPIDLQIISTARNLFTKGLLTHGSHRVLEDKCQNRNYDKDASANDPKVLTFYAYKLLVGFRQQTFGSSIANYMYK